MRVFVCGDTHRINNLKKVMGFRTFAINKELGLTKDDFLIVCGDFGLLWDSPYTLQWTEEEGSSIETNREDKCWSKKELDLLEWYEKCPWTTLFVDGNHENFDRLETYPVIEWKGGRAQKISDSVLHLMRGEIYDIGGKTFFCFGGAESTDRGPAVGDEEESRGNWWWPAEVPSDEEKIYARQQLLRHNNKIDYIITHTAPSSLINLLGYRAAPTSDFLEIVNNDVTYAHWYCGHLHIDFDYENISVLYNQMPKEIEV